MDLDEEKLRGIWKDLREVASNGDSRSGIIEYGLLMEKYKLDHLIIRHYLEEISRRTSEDRKFPERHMLSAVVVQKRKISDTRGGFRPGDGFYELAEQIGLLRKDSTAEEKDTFHNKQLKLCWSYYKK